MSCSLSRERAVPVYISLCLQSWIWGLSHQVAVFLTLCAESLICFSCEVGRRVLAVHAQTAQYVRALNSSPSVAPALPLWLIVPPFLFSPSVPCFCPPFPSPGFIFSLLFFLFHWSLSLPLCKAHFEIIRSSCHAVHLSPWLELLVAGCCLNSVVLRQGSPLAIWN